MSNISCFTRHASSNINLSASIILHTCSDFRHGKMPLDQVLELIIFSSFYQYVSAKIVAGAFTAIESGLNVETVQLKMI